LPLHPGIRPGKGIYHLEILGEDDGAGLEYASRHPANLANGATRHGYGDVVHGDGGVARPGSGDGAAWWTLFPEAWMHPEAPERVPGVIWIQSLAGANFGVLEPEITGWYENP